MNFSKLRLPAIRTTWCDEMLVRFHCRRWIVLSQALGVIVLLSGFVAPVCHRPASNHDMKKSLRTTVYIFDTRTVFSCEEFASETLYRPLVNMEIHTKDQWERMKAYAKAFHPKGHASPECLVQAGLMVL